MTRSFIVSGLEFLYALSVPPGWPSFVKIQGISNENVGGSYSDIHLISFHLVFFVSRGHTTT